jgi:hypothetical protein
MMEATGISETSVYFNDTTWRYIVKGYHIYITLAFPLGKSSLYVSLLQKQLLSKEC